ncbi:MAG: S8 family serine peptidase [Bacteroidales bacterium]|nr:S8 family serine peptidase [Bacteroidales bacterium]
MKTITVTLIKTGLFLGLLSVFFPLHSQQSPPARQPYYYYKGERVSLRIDKEHVNIRLEDEPVDLSLSRLEKLNLEPAVDKEDIRQGGITKFKVRPSGKATDYAGQVKELKKEASVRNVFPFVGSNGDYRSTSDLFYVRLKSLSDTTLLFALAREKDIDILRPVASMPLWYALSFLNSPSFENSLEATNYFYETGYFEEIDPAFMFDFRPSCSNDSLFNRLWGLQNTSFPGIDINICEAWTLSKGAGVTVAVLDQGIQRDHPDLAANMHHLSLDARSNPRDSIPSNYDYHDAHGTQVAGIIAAVKDNNFQVVGVAPEAKIMGIGHNLDNSDKKMSEYMVNGMNWAVDNGADVINNSWGDQLKGDLASSLLEGAIMNALTHGRGGKGCIVVFAAGNNGAVDYPARFHDDILCVGAIDSVGDRADFGGGYKSAAGIKLDLVAPGKEIYTTDNNGGFIAESGTSYAAPYVSGVAALMLSSNPDLTGKQVRDILERTARKIGNYPYLEIQERENGSWHEYVGYGLVDAYRAVKQVHYYVDDWSYSATGDIFAFPCEREVRIQDIDLQEGSMLVAGSNKKVKIVSSFKARKGSRIEITTPDKVREKYTDCNDDDRYR